MVSIWQTTTQFDRRPNGYACGGVLIDAYTVLTSARCMDYVSSSGFVVVAGQKYSSSRGLIGQPRSVRQYPNYRPGSFLFDIAVIDLYAPLVVESYPRVATNPEVTYLLRKPAVLYGWGENEHKKLPNVLRRVVQYDQSSLARKWFKDFSARIQFGAGRLNRNGTFSGACNRDSGSPMIGMVNGLQVVMGLASYGSLKSCTTKSPRVFTRVSWFGPWIAKVQEENASQRQAIGIDYSTAFFLGSASLMLPSESGTWVNDRTYISRRATFGLERSMVGTSDVESLTAYALTPSVQGDDFVFEVRSREPWTGNLCEWRDLAAKQQGPTFKLSLLDPSSKTFRTAVTFTYESTATDCFGEGGNLMTINTVNSSIAYVSCAPRLMMTDNGVLRAFLQQDCLTNMDQTMVRVELITNEAHEVEPGVDLWAGPFNLRHPLRG